MDPENKKEGWAIPIAILGAGLLVAGGIYFSDGTGSSSGNPAGKITIAPVSEKDHILGNPDADLVFVEFSDTECPFCKNFHEAMNKIMDEFGKTGKVAWVYRHFPLDSIHPKARKEAEATECAAKLGGNDAYWQYINTVFEITPSNNGLDLAELPEIARTIGLDVEAFNSCLESGEMADVVDSQFKDGIAAGASGTPYTVILFKNGLSTEQKSVLEAITVQSRGSIALRDDKVTIGGALPYETIKALIEELLK